MTRSSFQIQKFIPCFQVLKVFLQNILNFIGICCSVYLFISDSANWDLLCTPFSFLLLVEPTACQSFLLLLLVVFLQQANDDCYEQESPSQGRPHQYNVYYQIVSPGNTNKSHTIQSRLYLCISEDHLRSLGGRKGKTK